MAKEPLPLRPRMTSNDVSDGFVEKSTRAFPRSSSQICLTISAVTAGPGGACSIPRSEGSSPVERARAMRVASCRRQPRARQAAEQYILDMSPKPEQKKFEFGPKTVRQDRLMRWNGGV